MVDAVEAMVGEDMLSMGSSTCPTAGEPGAVEVSLGALVRTFESSVGSVGRKTTINGNTEGAWSTGGLGMWSSTSTVFLDAFNMDPDHFAWDRCRVH